MGTMKDRIAAAKARAEAAQATISADDAEEIRDREEEAQHLAAEREALKTARTLDLARRLEAARERIAAATGQEPEKVVLEALDLEDEAPGAGTYIVQAIPAKAHEKHTKATAPGKSDRDDGAALRDAALASVVDWNGHAITRDSTFGPEIRSVWDRYPLAPTSITNISFRLGGFRLSEKKG